MGWEVGGGLGHAEHLLQVARVLAAAGHEPVFAVRNVVEPWPLFARETFPVLQAPFWHPRPWHGAQPFQAGSYADVLALQGWDRSEHLRPQVEAWQQLIDRVQPKVIVCDHSPTLCLTAFRTLPTIILGTWFVMPPVGGDRFPVLLPGQAPVISQEQLLATVRQVQCERGRPEPNTLPEILAAADRFVTVFPELDPYHASRQEPVWDPITPLPAPVARPPGPSFFAYLNAAHAQVEPLLSMLGQVGCKGTAYLRGAGTPLKERLRQQGLGVLDAPARPADVLNHNAIVIHHGGSGLTHAAAAAGRPQFLLPEHLEQTLTARMLAKLGIGVLLGDQATIASAAQLIQQLVGDRPFADRARAFARTIKKRPRLDPLPAILQACSARLGE
jgi:Erythromycin biosynthesis protein CIII-like, C-terminal domain